MQKTLTSPPVLLYTFLEFLEATALTTDGRSLLPRPTTSLVSNRTHSFSRPFFFLVSSLYRMACHSRVNSFPLGICLYIFPSPMPLSPPFPLGTPPLCLSIYLAGVFLEFGRLDNGPWTWLVLPGVPSLGQSRCGSFFYNGLALCLLSVSLSSLFRLSCGQAIIDPIHPSANQ